MIFAQRKFYVTLFFIIIFNINTAHSVRYADTPEKAPAVRLLATASVWLTENTTYIPYTRTELRHPYFQSLAQYCRVNNGDHCEYHTIPGKKITSFVKDMESSVRAAVELTRLSSDRLYEVKIVFKSPRSKDTISMQKLFRTPVHAVEDLIFQWYLPVKTSMFADGMWNMQLFLDGQFEEQSFFVVESMIDRY